MLNFNHSTYNPDFVSKLFLQLSDYEFRFLANFISSYTDLSESELDIKLLNDNPELFFKICNIFGGTN